MRNLLALSVLLAFMPVAHAADKGADFTVGAEFRVRAQHDQASLSMDKDADTATNTVMHRFKIDTAYKASEKFGAHLTLINNALWGNFNSSGDSGTAIPDGTGDSQNMVLVNQAYGTWMINDTWSLKFGRGGATIGDGSVISQNDWEMNPYAFDGVLVNYEHEMFRLNIFGVKAIDNAAATAGYTAPNGNDDPEANFMGLAMDWKQLPEWLKMANVHLLQVNKDETGFAGFGAANASKKEMRYGVVLAGDTAGVDYKVQYASHDGEARLAGNKGDISGNMWAVNVGYSMPEVMKLHIGATYHVDSGNKIDTTAAADTKNEGYDSFYTEKHAGAGHMDILGWGNLTFIKAEVTMSPMDSVDAGLAFWKFSRTENTSGITKGSNGYAAYTYTAATTADRSDDIGTEYDLWATKKYDNGFSMTGRLGMFMPGAHLKNVMYPTPAVQKDDAFMQGFLEAKMTF